MDPSWRLQLHSPRPPTPLPVCLNTTTHAALTALTPSLFDDAPPSSLLLIGPHQSGKSLLTTYIHHHLEQQAATHNAHLTSVSLTGLLHAQPIRAWRHVAASLSSQDYSTASVQECLAAISDIFATFRAHRRPLLFILDHFDRFVTTADGMSQTVLYSLFNFFQDRHMRIACIAMTQSIDVTDGLEKRVKSRFVHRQLVVPLPEQPADALDWISQVLLKEKATRRSSKSNTYKITRTFLAHDRCIAAVRKNMLRTRVISPILIAVEAALVSVLQDLSRSSIKSRVEHACHVFETFLASKDHTADLLSTLTQLEITLLMALRKLVAQPKARDAKVSITFSDVFRHHATATVDVGFSADKDPDRRVELRVAEKSWERLVECGAVVRLGQGPREMRSCVLGLAAHDVDRALQDHTVASLVWKNWGKSK